MDLKPGMDPANPHDDIPLYLRDEPPVVVHERGADNWLALRVTAGRDSVWLYSPISSSEAVNLIAADPDSLDDVVASSTAQRSVLMVTAYQGQVITHGWIDAAATPLATAHQWITTHTDAQ